MSARLYSLTSWLRDLPETARSSFFPFSDRKILVSGSSTSTPTATHTRPTGRKEKNPSGSYPAAVRVSWMIRFGGVPIRVIIPPILLAKARGMSSRPELTPAPAARLTTIGSMRATVPVLLTNAPMAEVTSMTSRNSRVSLLPASFRILELIILASPVWNMAPPTMNRPAIMITTELEKPESASAGVSI